MWSCHVSWWLHFFFKLISFSCITTLLFFKKKKETGRRQDDFTCNVVMSSDDLPLIYQKKKVINPLLRFWLKRNPNIQKGLIFIYIFLISFFFLPQFHFSFYQTSFHVHIQKHKKYDCWKEMHEFLIEIHIKKENSTTWIYSWKIHNISGFTYWLCFNFGILNINTL